jgi:hypothetical protein
MTTRFDSKLSEAIDTQRRRGHFDEEEIRRAYGQLLAALGDAMRRARAEKSPGAYGQLEMLLGETRHDLRESVQALTHQRMWGIIRRLRDGDDIDDEDRELIRLWMVGDAAAYVFEEQTFEHWLAHLDRLGSEIAACAESDPEPQILTTLSGLLTDAHDVVIDVTRYLQMRERIARFHEAMASAMDAANRQALADVLVHALHSRAV